MSADGTVRDDRPASAGRLALGELTDRLGFHLRMAQIALWRDFTASLSQVDLTQRQAAVMELVDANPGVSQVDLASALGADRATMMAIIDRLEQRRLIERRRSAEDRRRQELHLTPAGASLLGQARKLIAEHERRFRCLFTPDELDGLMDALKRIHGLRQP